MKKITLGPFYVYKKIKFALGVRFFLTLTKEISNINGNIFFIEKFLTEFYLFLKISTRQLQKKEKNFKMSKNLDWIGLTNGKKFEFKKKIFDEKNSIFLQNNPVKNFQLKKKKFTKKKNNLQTTINIANSEIDRSIGSIIKLRYSGISLEKIEKINQMAFEKLTETNQFFLGQKKTSNQFFLSFFKFHKLIIFLLFFLFFC
ncbi:hypothetical protein HAN_2g353 (nucleomorph) [Hemiselmis andersenii]|uniref:Uncharacterized protein n=1 Tax=Hemiselmis andersenii TaxID=464988 RepID=A9BKJ8_HEMAN|nr:hypothetical protein HAN_2g353 [Hemiselmis andersenii]ABW98169.1 hypothetical protein HAN_2g353 [Hemiselmis andersenii]|mmetsp:Transcript_27030/g.65758  ORF Transcript_27030/g.65758 Transcript_27030/m.65758 type:complete len:201 (-) Transcript_27030:195-797(-)